METEPGSGFSVGEWVEVEVEGKSTIAPIKSIEGDQAVFLLPGRDQVSGRAWHEQAPKDETNYVQVRKMEEHRVPLSALRKPKPPTS